MDFLDPRKKRVNRIQLFIGYGLVGIALVIATAIVVYMTFGYGLDRKTGAIIQNGFVFIDAHPQSAEIYIDGSLKGTTKTRLLLQTGSYNVQLKRANYRDWNKTITVDGSTVQQLIYPFMFPQKLQTKDVDLLSTPPALLTQSPDRQWLLVQQMLNQKTLDLINLNDKSNPITTLTFPEGFLVNATNMTSKNEVVEWSFDNRHVLLKQTTPASSQFLLIDIQQPTLSINLNKELKVDLTDVHLRNRQFDQYYILNKATGDLTSYDLKTHLSSPMLNKVITYKSYGNSDLVYVTSQGAIPGQNVVKIKDNDASYTLRSVVAGSEYLLDLTQYNNSWYMLVGAKNENKVYEYKDPLTSLKRIPLQLPVPQLLKIDNPQFVAFSDNNRFASVQSGSKFDVYDAEYQRQYRYDTKVDMALDNTQAHWMDDSHLMVQSTKNKAVVFDFDGLNIQSLSSIVGVTQPYFDQAYTELYALAPSISVPSRLSITRTELIVQ
ncbi:MAG: hypothetical protein NVS3B23_07350 [Candidatus Saccharimonadales bacterium]